MDSFLKFLLSKKQTLDSINDFCRSKKTYCQDNKETVCERILNVSGYKTKNFYRYSSTNFCGLYKEMIQMKSSDLKMTPELLNKINRQGSNELQSFVVFNGYTFERVSEIRNKFSFADSIRDLQTFLE